MSEQDKQKLIEAKKAEHGKIVVLEAEETDSEEAVFIIAKSPPRPEYKRYRSMLFDDGQRADALEELTKACVVYPGKDELARILADQPALVMAMGNKLTAAAGAEREIIAKKY